MSNDPLKDLVEEAAKGLPFRRDYVRETLDFEIVPQMIYEDGEIFIDNCRAGKEDYICALFNHYYKRMNPIYYKDDPRIFTLEDFFVGFKKMPEENVLLYIRLPDELGGSFEYCRAYVITFHFHERKPENIQFYAIQNSSYGWARLGKITREGKNQFMGPSSGDLKADLEFICNHAFG